MARYKLIIAGSRTWTNREALAMAVRKYFNHYNLSLDTSPVEIVSGMAPGADTMAVQFAESLKWPVKRMPANWDEEGRAAGYLRNERMAKYADGCIVLWDGVSKGSKHMIDLARHHKLNLLIVKPKTIYEVFWE